MSVQRTPQGSTKSKSNGFTLIEMVIAVAILALLASIALPQYRSYTQNSKERAATADLSALAVAIENQYQKTLLYPADSRFNGSTSLLSYDKWSPSQNSFVYTVSVATNQDSYTLHAKSNKTNCELNLDSSNRKSANSNCHAETQQVWK